MYFLMFWVSLVVVPLAALFLASIHYNRNVVEQLSEEIKAYGSFSTHDIGALVAAALMLMTVNVLVAMIWPVTFVVLFVWIASLVLARSTGFFGKLVKYILMPVYVPIKYLLLLPGMIAKPFFRDTH